MCREDIHYTEETLLKVFDALRRCHATEEQAREAIREMLNAGILFRERGSNPYERPKTQIHRGAGSLDDGRRPRGAWDDAVFTGTRPADSKDIDPSQFKEPIPRGGNIFENFSERTRLPRDPLVAGKCPTCEGTYRETVGMICPTCFHDYSQEER